MKAFNHLPFEQMMSPVAAGHRRVLFVSGDDADAKASVMSVIRANGFAAVDLRILGLGIAPPTGGRSAGVAGPVDPRGNAIIAADVASSARWVQ